jgi:uncharacterized protein YigE (DUF2233 family)
MSQSWRGFCLALLLCLPPLPVQAAIGSEPCVERSLESARFTVCSFDATRQDLRLADRAANGAYLRGFERLSPQLGDDRLRVLFAMNAGMFNNRGAPIGLYVEAGIRRHRINLSRGPGNFHLLPNGVFWQSADGAVHVTESRAYAAQAPRPRLATQSGPMLVIEGEIHPSFSDDGDSRLIRNGVGVLDDHTAFFAISETDVSFGKFARFFRDSLQCRNALFLDGNVSSLWVPSRHRRDDARLLGPMLVVLSRE